MTDELERKRRKYAREELELLETITQGDGDETVFIKSYVAKYGEVRTYQSLVEAWRRRNELLRRLEKIRTVVKPKVSRKDKTSDEVLTRLAAALEQNTEMLGDLYKAHRMTQRLLLKSLGVKTDERGGSKT